MLDNAFMAEHSVTNALGSASTIIGENVLLFGYYLIRNLPVVSSGGGMIDGWANSLQGSLSTSSNVVAIKSKVKTAFTDWCLEPALGKTYKVGMRAQRSLRTTCTIVLADPFYTYRLEKSFYYLFSYYVYFISLTTEGFYVDGQADRRP